MCVNSGRYWAEFLVRVVADIMRKTRLTYHYAIRRVKRDEKDIISDRFAQAVLNGHDRDFWAEVKRVRGKGSTTSNIVDGCSDAGNIAALFADKYQDLYCSVAFNEVDMSHILSELNCSVAKCGFDSNCIITSDDVASAVLKLKPHKNDGYPGLSSDHIKYGGNELCVHISLLLSGMLCHGCVPENMSVSTVIPIPKGRNINLTDSANYRGISLSSMFGKILDLIVLARYSDFLVTSDLQFGFKEKCSTGMCSAVLKECISYYITNNSTVYCTMLDATKAFDRVEYCKLFRQLMSRKIPPVFIRLLLNMYINHNTRVNWNGIFSDCFSVRNGVKQGGILSPILFCIYFDCLLHELVGANVGCFIGRFFVGVLAYADDLVLLAPTPHAMRRMLEVCDRYANEFNVVFNAGKSKCLIVRPRRHSNLKHVFVPSFYVGGKTIEFVSSWPHLGHIITDSLCDSADINSRRNHLVGQINNVLCYFRNLDSVTKVRLLKAYCSSYYGCELWDFWDKEVESFCKAWRHGQRAVWKLPYNTHSRYLPIVCNSIPIMDELCRRFLSFLHKCSVSQNKLVNFVIRFGVLFGGMFSGCGRNALFCSSRYSVDSVDFLRNNLSFCFIKEKCAADISATDMSNVLLLLELLFIRDGIFSVDAISHDNIIDCISTVCAS